LDAPEHAISLKYKKHLKHCCTKIWHEQTSIRVDYSYFAICTTSLGLFWKLRSIFNWIALAAFLLSLYCYRKLKSTRFYTILYEFILKFHDLFISCHFIKPFTITKLKYNTVKAVIFAAVLFSRISRIDLRERK